MLDELPKVTDSKDIKTLRDAFDKIQTSAMSVEYGTTVPTQLGFGRLYVMDDGAGSTAVYIKTAKGNIIAI